MQSTSISTTKICQVWIKGTLNKEYSQGEKVKKIDIDL
jgi:hypothetical protein